MPAPLVITLAVVFISVAIVVGLTTSAILSSRSTERKRLRTVTSAAPSRAAVVVRQIRSLSTDLPTAGWHGAASKLGRSKKELSRLRSRLARAGFDHPAAPVVYTLLEFVAPVLVAAVPLLWLEGPLKWLAVGAAVVGMYFAPGLLVDYRLAVRKREIENGLPDALDLLVVCIEAGCGLDQAIVKASEELAIAYPRLADELRILTTELRAGKPRIDAFRSLANRTKIDDVRALVAMLVQTDRFGTSIGQALRTHADATRDRRRQRAEERAQKIAVKLVFPLVLCFFPAFYVVILGPVVIQFLHTFAH
jgi:tight adherence protein C